MNKKSNILLESFSKTILPAVKPDFIEWCSTNLRYDLGSDVYSTYSPTLSPWHKTCAEWFTDDNTRQIVIIAPVQIGKSNFIINAMLYGMVNDPSPLMLCLADESTCSKVAVKFLKTLEHSFPILAKPALAEFSKSLGGFIGGSDLHLAWSTSEARLRTVSRKYLFLDETSLYKVPLDLIIERTKQFNHSCKVVITTSPTETNEQTWIKAKSDCTPYNFIYPCPHCSTYQQLSLDSLVFDHCKDTNGKWNLEEVRKNTYLKCSSCYRPISQDYQYSMLQKGKAYTENPSGAIDRKSLFLTCFDSPVESWGSIAVKFLRAKPNVSSLKNFVCNTLGEAWEDRAGELSVTTLSKRFDEGMDFGFIPENTDLLISSVDVQRKSIYFTVRAFLQDKRSVLIYCNKFETTDDDVLPLLEKYRTEIFLKEWPSKDGTQTFKINFAGVDSADGHNTNKIYYFCQKYKGRIVPIKGFSSKLDEPVKITDLTEDSLGRPLLGGLKLYKINSPFYRSLIVQAYSEDIKAQSSMLISKGTPDEYIQHLCESWKLLTTKGRNGLVTKSWKQVSSNDHYLDTEIYILGLYEIAKGFRFQREVMQVSKAKPASLTPSPIPITRPIRTKYY